METALWFSLVVFSTQPVLSDTDANYRRAADHTRRALLQQEFVKERIKATERLIKNRLEEDLGITEDDFAYVIWTVPLAYGKVSTRPFKNFGWKGETWIIRPELEYQFRGREEFTSEFNIEWQF